MSIYVPNIGEKEALKQILKNNALVLGLYVNQVVPDGNTIIDTLTEMTTDGGRTYAQIELSNDIVETTQTADKWYVYSNSSGKAEAKYDDSTTTQDWTFAAADVADAATVYGIFAYTWVLPFDAGAVEIKVGDKIKGVTSAATGIVTAVDVQSGSWGAGTAAGNLYIKTKTGTFQDNENVCIYGAVASITVVSGGTGYAVGDILQITQSGGSGVKLVVSAINTGAVTAAVIVEGGTGYATGTALPTTHLSGSGNNDCTITIASIGTTTRAVTNTGATADALKKLMFVEAFTSGQLIDTVGQKISYTLKLTLSTA